LANLLVGPSVTTLPGLTDKQRVIAFASFSQFLLAAAYFGLAFMPEGAVGLGQFCYTAVIALSGLDTVSVLKSLQLTSGRFVHVLMSVNSLNESLTLFGLAAAVSIFVPTSTSEEWSRVFIFMGAMMTIFTIIFNCTTEVTPRSWAAQTSDISQELNFEFPAERLANLQQIERVINDRRMSIKNHKSSLPRENRKISILSLTRVR
uniref:Solute carrier family 40 protein n=1 Tax=Bursaphelenchus xylophilus TaxID=6326 RepID=A0A1I7SKP2_BURXY